jgi:hypothetical protein
MSTSLDSRMMSSNFSIILVGVVVVFCYWEYFSFEFEITDVYLLLLTYMLL